MLFSKSICISLRIPAWLILFYYQNPLIYYFSSFSKFGLFKPSSSFSAGHCLKNVLLPPIEWLHHKVDSLNQHYLIKLFSQHSIFHPPIHFPTSTYLSRITFPSIGWEKLIKQQSIVLFTKKSFLSFYPFSIVWISSRGHFDFSNEFLVSDDIQTPDFFLVNILQKFNFC